MIPTNRYSRDNASDTVVRDQDLPSFSQLNKPAFESWDTEALDLISSNGERFSQRAVQLLDLFYVGVCGEKGFVGEKGVREILGMRWSDLVKFLSLRGKGCSQLGYREWNSCRGVPRAVVAESSGSSTSDVGSDRDVTDITSQSDPEGKKQQERGPDGVLLLPFTDPQNGEEEHAALEVVVPDVDDYDDDDDVGFWTWDSGRELFVHRDEMTGELICCPRELD